MINAAGDEFFDYSENALPAAGEIFKLRPTPVKDLLMNKRTAVIDIEKGLVLRVVRKKGGVDFEHAGTVAERNVKIDFHGLPVGQGLDSFELDRRSLPSCVDRQAGPKEFKTLGFF